MRHILGTVILKVLDIFLYHVKALPACDVIDCHTTMRVAVVSLRDRSKSLLTCSVPYLKLNDSIVHFKSPNLEINSHCARVVLIEHVVSKSHEHR